MTVHVFCSVELRKLCLTKNCSWPARKFSDDGINALKRSFYTDDLLTSKSNSDEAIVLVKQLIESLATGGFRLTDTLWVPFNRFIDLKLNFHTNPYNLVSSRLFWFWASCDAVTLSTLVRFETMIWPSREFKNSLDIFWPRIERKRSEEYLEYFDLLVVKKEQTRRKATRFYSWLRIFRDISFSIRLRE